MCCTPPSKDRTQVSFSATRKRLYVQYYTSNTPFYDHMHDFMTFFAENSVSYSVGMTPEVGHSPRNIVHKVQVCKANQNQDYGMDRCKQSGFRNRQVQFQFCQYHKVHTTAKSNALEYNPGICAAVPNKNITEIMVSSSGVLNCASKQINESKTNITHPLQ